MTAPAHERAHPDDPRLAPYRGVRDADLRGRDGLHCVETARVVRRFLAACARRAAAPCPPPLRVHSVLCDERTLPALAPLLAALPGTPTFVAPDADAVTAISGYDLHSGALALGVRAPDPDESALAAGARALVQLTGGGGFFDARAAALAARGVDHEARCAECAGAASLLHLLRTRLPLRPPPEETT
jgi:hypothetical protein